MPALAPSPPETMPLPELTEALALEPTLVSREVWQQHIAEAIGCTAGTPLENIGEPLSFRAAIDQDVIDVATATQIIQGLQQTGEAQPLVDQDTFIDGRTVDQEHALLVNTWPAVRQAAIWGIDDLMQRRYIPPQVAARLTDALDKTHIQVTDMAVIGFLAQGAPAYYDRHDNIRLGALHDRAKFRHLGLHEILHKLSGGTFRRTRGQDAPAERQRAGFANLDSTGQTHGYITEAVTEHVTCSVLYGTPSDVNPFSRQDILEGYVPARALLAAFTLRSGNIVDIKHFTRALFEDTTFDGSEHAGDFAERRALVQAANAAYGPGALRKLELLCEAATAVCESETERSGIYRRTNPLIDRIVPPVLGPDGTVIERGYIDINGLD